MRCGDDAGIEIVNVFISDWLIGSCRQAACVKFRTNMV